LTRSPAVARQGFRKFWNLGFVVAGFFVQFVYDVDAIGHATPPMLKKVAFCPKINYRQKATFYQF
jgi:hypothetical protein